ncbi:universal stress protein [Actinomadura rugatobispora]|uniref:Universal stress protein n=1 Tax=Actinomadura rugatobispora TaxID=1994 RepID=A0ABW0ZTQ9_9ACTN|nr:universal stress protein [Actinomadura rugatobispora]
MGRYVLVGYDGSQESDYALAWAVEEARLRELPLEVVHAWRWPYPIDYIDYEGTATLKRVGQHVLNHGAELAQRAEPTVAVRRHLMNGPAHVALKHQCRDAELAVVGARGRGELPVGSTALRLPARSTCPVVVVRNAAARSGLVVAGVDGSPGGEAALAFAFRQAALRGWSLLAVHGCWEPSAVPEADLALFSEQEKLLQMCQTRLDHAVEPWRIRYPEVEAATSVPMLPPREALFEAAEDAALAVVGNRGTGGFDPLLLGATSGTLLQHAPCAVAIVQPEARP